MSAERCPLCERKLSNNGTQMVCGRCGWNDDMNAEDERDLARDLDRHDDRSDEERGF